MDRREIIQVIKEAGRVVVSEAVDAKARSDFKAKVSWEIRGRILDDLLGDFQASLEGASPPRRVFVSYSKRSGTVYFQRVKQELTKIGFEVLTGFDPAPGDRDNVLARILGQLRRSTLYIGLLTKEMKVKGPDSLSEEPRWSPSVWTMEEKGMALALEKPFFLLVHQDVHEDFWLKSAPHKVHAVFNDETFETVSLRCVESVAERYDELVLRYAGARFDFS